MLNKKGFVYLVLGFGFMTHSAFAQGDRITVTLGDVRSPVLASVAAKRSTRDGREIARAAERQAETKSLAAGDQKEEAKRAIKRVLADADLVAADLAAIVPTEEDKLIAEAAREMGVPIAFENVEREKMALLVPVGVDADLVLLESASGGSRANVHVWKDGLDTFVDGGATASVRLSGKPVAGETRPKSLESPAGRRSPSPLRPVPSSAADLNAGGFAQVLGEVEEILSQHPFSRGAQSHDLLTNQCVNTRRCFEFQSSYAPYYWCPGGTCTAVYLNTNITAGMYATPTSKYAVMRTIGSNGTQLAWDSYTDSGYFLEVGTAAFRPTAIPANWTLDRSKPANEPNGGSISSTTGFEISGTPSTSPITVGFSTSATGTINVTDWMVANNSAPPTASWRYQLHLVGSGTLYGTWTDLIKGDNEWAWEPGLHSLPNCSKYNYEMENEAVYRWPGSAQGNFSWNATWMSQVRHTWRTSWTFFTADYASQYAAVTRDTGWTLNLSWLIP